MPQRAIRRRFLHCLVVCLSLLCVPSLLFADSQTREVSDDAGRHVTIPARITRVFVAGPPAAVLLYTLAPEDLLNWVEAPSTAAKPYLAPPYRDLPAYGRLTGHGKTIDPATLKALHPDLILDIGDVDAGYAALADRIQQQTGIPYLLLNGHLDKTVATYQRLGEILGKTDRAASLARYAQQVLRDLPAAIAAHPQGRQPRLYYGRGKDGLQSAGPGAINLEIYDLLGADNVAAGTLGRKLQAVDRAQLLAWNPDIIVAQGPAFRDTLLRDPAWHHLDAVTSGRIYRQPMLPFGWVDDPPSVNRVLGAQWLAPKLYPGLNWGDPRDIARGFYKLFYQVDLSDRQLDALLSDTPPKQAAP
jgi:iron complex transport system substrate-binding protein